MRKFILGLMATLVVAAPLALVEAPANAAPPTSSRIATVQIDSYPTARVVFDRRYLLQTSRYVITDMRSINTRLRDGIAVSSGFYLLSGSYGYMLNAGVPPKIQRKARYKARISTLRSFAARAGDEYYYDRTSALARYSVIRMQTRILFRQINAAIGSELRVP